MHRGQKIVKDAVDGVLEQIPGAGIEFMETDHALGWAITFVSHEVAFIALFSEGTRFVLGEAEFFKIEVPEARGDDSWVEGVMSAVKQAISSDDKILPYADRLRLSKPTRF